MIPILQVAMIGLAWAFATCIVLLTAEYCCSRMIATIADALRPEADPKIQNGQGEEAGCEGEAHTT